MSKLKISTNSIIWSTTIFGDYDTSDWQSIDLDTLDTEILSMDYGNGLWFAGTSSQIFRSTNGINWTKIPPLPYLTNNISSITYGNNLLLIAGTNEIRSSTNGISWITIGSNISSIVSLVYGANLWIAGGDTQIRRSTDSINWSTVISTISSSIKSISYGNNLWCVGATGGQLSNSTNGITWNIVSSTFGNTAINTLAYGNGIFIAGGDSGQVRKSTDTTNWSTISSWTTLPIYSVAYNNGIWVFGSNSGNIFRSTDTVTWNSVISNFSSSYYVRFISYQNNRWLASSFNQIRLSTDSINWTTSNSNFTNNINSINYQNGLWIAVGDSGVIRYSTDTISWNNTLLENFSSTAIRYSNNVWFIKPGNLSGSRISTDGISWGTASFADFYNRSIDYGQNQWIFGASEGYIDYQGVPQLKPKLRSSTDLISWTSLSSGLGPKEYIGSVVYGNGQWVAGRTGTVSNALGAQISKSTDGITWTATTVISYGGNVMNLAYENTSSLWAMSLSLNDDLIKSTDLISWTSSFINLNGDKGNIAFLNSKNNLFFVVSSQPAAFEYSNHPNMTFWTTIPILPSINNIVYGNNLWVVFGKSKKIYFANELTYKKQNATNDIIGIEKFNNGWVAVTTNNEILINYEKISGPGVFTYLSKNLSPVKQITSIEDKIILLENNKIMESKNLITWTTNYLSWITVYNDSSTNYFKKIGYANKQWVAGGKSNIFIKSTDSINWTTFNSNFTSTELTTDVSGIVYGNGIWLAGAYYQAKFRRSTDTINWVTVFSPSVADLRTLAYGNGRFIAPVNMGRVLTTTDSISWTTLQFFASTTTFGTCVEYANGLWVMGTNIARTWFSTNGLSWSSVLTPTAITSIAYNQGIWLGVSSGNGIIIKSTNGITWQTSTWLTGQVFNVASYGNGVWLAYNTSTPSSSMKSTDLLSWTTAYEFITNSTTYDIKYGNGDWVITGQNNNILSYTDNIESNNKFNKFIKTKNNQEIFLLTNKNIIYRQKKIDTNTWKVNKTYINDNFINGAISLDYTSYDIENTAKLWQGSISNLYNNNATIYSLIYKNNIWVAGGTVGTLYTSTDSINWTTQNSNFGNTTIRSIDYGNGMWVLVGEQGQLRTSTDTTQWTTVLSNFINNNILSVSYNNGLWFAVGNSGQIRRSTDTISWITINANFGNTNIKNITYGNGIWTAVGDSGNIRISTDTETWTTVNSNFGTTIISSIAYGNNRWVIGGYSAQMRISTNASSWTTVFITSLVAGNIINSINYANGIWTAAVNKIMFKSTNAVSWITVSGLQPSNNIYSISYGNNIWLINDLNKMIKSEAIFNPYLYDIIGNNASYRSTDLISWTTIITLSSPVTNQTEINDITSKY